MKKFGLSILAALILATTPAHAVVIDFTGTFTTGVDAGQPISGSFDFDLNAPLNHGNNLTASFARRRRRRPRSANGRSENLKPSGPREKQPSGKPKLKLLDKKPRA